jgi:uncharacterized protein DUF3105
MADKPRTPPPRQQGPRKRPTVQAPGQRRGVLGQRSALLSGVLVGGLIVAAVLVFFLTRGGTKSKPANNTITPPTAQMTAAGCTLKSVPPLSPTNTSGGFHADSPTLTSKVKWSTDPPSAGGHYQTPAIWDFYTDAVNPRQVVHNEEHGGMIMWWGDKVPAATVAKLRTFYDESPNSMVGTPYASLGSKIALTAWTGNPSTYSVKGDYGIGHIAVCPTFDAKAFRAFRDAYRGKGPEGVPMSSNTPGSG